MKDKRYSEENIKDWEQLPMISSVITSGYFGAWLYYRDKRRDKIVNSELLDKVADRINSGCTCTDYSCGSSFNKDCENCSNYMIDYPSVIEVINELKAEVSE